MIRVFAPLFAATLAFAPVGASAEETSPGQDLLEEGAQMLLRHMFRELEPHMGEILQMQDLAKALGDLNQYQLPEVLPNGDILIRRKPGAPPRGPDDEPEVGEGGEVDL